MMQGSDLGRKLPHWGSQICEGRSSRDLAMSLSAPRTETRRLVRQDSEMCGYDYLIVRWPTQERCGCTQGFEGLELLMEKRGDRKDLEKSEQAL